MNPMQTQRRLVLASAVLHVLALVAVLSGRRMHVAPTRLPGTHLGSRISLTYAPGRARSESVVAAARPLAAKPALRLKALAAVLPQTALSATSPQSTHPDAAEGGDALGNGNVTVALATYFPWPRPAVPQGTHGDVIVDVVIDEQGKIVRSEVAHSLGEAVDEQVLTTIQTWTFKPATRNGVAVPSEQELLFHYDRG